MLSTLLTICLAAAVRCAPTSSETDVPAQTEDTKANETVATRMFTDFQPPIGQNFLDAGRRFLSFERAWTSPASNEIPLYNNYPAGTYCQPVNQPYLPSYQPPPNDQMYNQYDPYRSASGMIPPQESYGYRVPPLQDIPSQRPTPYTSQLPSSFPASPMVLPNENYLQRVPPQYEMMSQRQIPYGTQLPNSIQSDVNMCPP